MSNPYQMFITDGDLETQGVVLNYGKFKVKIARAGGANKKYKKVLLRKLKPYKRQIETETLDEDVSTNIMADIYADSVIIGWGVEDDKGNTVSGIHDMEGNIIPFNKENVVATLLALPELFKDIQAQAEKVAVFKAEELETEAKNS